MEKKLKEKSSDLMGKIAAAKEMRDLASSMMKEGIGGKMKSLREVKVAADSKEGLKKGLEKAQDILASKEEAPEEAEELNEVEESPEEELAEEVSEESEDEHADVLEKCDTPEKIDALIAKLEAKKAELQKD